MIAALGQILGLRGEALATSRLRSRARSMPSTSTLTVPSGSFSELQDRGERGDLVDVLRTRVVDVGLRLGDEQDLAARGHRLVERRHRPLSAHEQRDDGMGVHDDVAQRQDRQGAARSGLVSAYQFA